MVPPGVAALGEDGHPGPVSARSDFFSIRFTADPVQLIFFRAGLDRWLRVLQWPEPDRVDALLAVSEACTNSVEHAYAAGAAGEVEVVGRLVVGSVDRRVVVVVRDHGRWRPVPGGTGYGLTTVQACMERVKIHNDDTGTVVTMHSRPVPLLDGHVRPEVAGFARGGGQRNGPGPAD